MRILVWLVTQARQSGLRVGVQQSPLEIAEERFARGEIDRQQFEEIRDTLSRR